MYFLVCVCVCVERERVSCISSFFSIFPAPPFSLILSSFLNRIVSDNKELYCRRNTAAINSSSVAGDRASDGRTGDGRVFVPSEGRCLWFIARQNAAKCNVWTGTLFWKVGVGEGYETVGKLGLEERERERE